MKKLDIITVGSAIRDIVFYTNEAELISNPKNPIKLKLLGFEYGAKIKSSKVRATFGGGAMNSAVNFSGLNLKTGILACIGKDETGQEIIRKLKKNKIETSLLQRSSDLPTGVSFLVVDEKTDEHVIFVNYGANENINFKVQMLNVKTDWYYISGLAAKNWPIIIKGVKSRGAKIAWNPGHDQLKSIKRYAKNIDVLILNKDEATEVVLGITKNYSVKNLLKIIYEFGPRMVVITDGRNGVYVFDGHKIYFDKPHHGKPKDTTGAGDCFGSTFVAGLIKLGDIKKAMRLGIVNTSSLVMKPGAQEGLLTWNKLKNKI